MPRAQVATGGASGNSSGPGRHSRSSFTGLQATPMVGSKNPDRVLCPGTTPIGCTVVHRPGAAQPEMSMVVVPESRRDPQFDRIQRARMLQLIAEDDTARGRSLAGDPGIGAEVRIGSVQVHLERMLLVAGVGDRGDLGSDQERKQDQSSPRSPNSFIFICRLFREILSNFAVRVTFPFVTSRPRTIKSRSIAWTCSLTISFSGPG